MVRLIPLLSLLAWSAGCSSDVGDDLAPPPSAFNLAAPNGLIATPLGGRQVRLDWQDNATGETEYRIDAAYFPFTSVYDASAHEFAPANATTLTLEASFYPTTYFRVIAIMENERQSGYSNIASVTLSLPPPAPEFPAATLASPTEISLTWRDVDYETSYRIERSTDDGATWSSLALLPADSTSHLDGSLAPGIKYTYRIIAINTAGEGPPSDAVFAITPTSSTDVSTACDAAPAGWYSSIAVDASGNEHISHYSPLSTDCLYTTNATGTFVTETADSGPAFNSIIGDGGTSIGVDSSGVVHLAAYDASNGDLRYANNDSGSFVAITLDAAGDIGWSPRLRIHPIDDSIHIVYKADSTLRLAVFDGLIWTFETFTPVEPIGTFSFALDPSGNPHVAYELRTDPSYPEIVHARRPGGIWTFETVPVLYGRLSEPSIAADASGAAHIIFCRDFISNRTLQYATNAGGSWTFEAADDPGGGSNLGQYNSLALDPVSGRLHAAYYDEGNGDLRYARKDPGGLWVQHVIDTEGDVGKYTSIAVDTSRLVHISYYDVTHDSLKRASGAP